VHNKYIFIESSLMREDGIEHVRDKVSVIRRALDTNCFGGPFHPESRESMVFSESRGFVAISKNITFFTVETIVVLVLFGLDGSNNAGLFHQFFSNKDITNFNGFSSNQTILSVNQMVMGKAKRTVAGGLDFNSISSNNVWDNTVWLKIRVGLKVGNGEGLKATLVGDFGISVEA